MSSDEGLVLGEVDGSRGPFTALRASLSGMRFLSDLEAGSWRGEPGLGIGQGSLVVLLSTRAESLRASVAKWAAQW